MKRKLFALLIVTSLFVSGCTTEEAVDQVANAIIESYESDIKEDIKNDIKDGISQGIEDVLSGGGNSSATIDSSEGYTVVTPDSLNAFSYDQVPAYSGESSVIINGNVPFFTEDDWISVSVNPERYGELDSLGRCTGCMALVSLDTMPTEERGEIGQIKPTGWHTVKYDFISGNYLYNRCHLIGYQLTGENANPLNLVTGTRYMNVVGQLPYENAVADYVQSTGDPLLYRVTPVFIGDDLVCRGVLTEVANRTGSVSICAFCYNVQPGVEIDYATGESCESGDLTGTDYVDPFVTP